MKKMYFILITMGMIALHSCTKNDNPSLYNVPDPVTKAFEQNYAGASNLNWETRNVSASNYYRATFRNAQGYETEVWYAPDGTWYMTITEMPYAAIPQAVKNIFESSEYNDRTVYERRDGEVDFVERLNSKSVYIIDVETLVGEVDWDLYYTEDGIFVMGVDERGNSTNSNSGNTGTGGDTGSTGNGATAGGDTGALLPTTPTGTYTSVQDAIAKLFPNARIIEIEREYSSIEVDIIDLNVNRGKEVRLNSTTFEWISTSWEVRSSELPSAVAAYISANFSGYYVDDADYFETPTGNFYVIELERGEAERHLRITPEGIPVS
ncbi:MAG: PepSY-like domain-containing protein [Mediterranea sp.]|jgi:hypothetical protein|nr:PepSY-like domain-containing protein [Mediterranea sp.]